VLGGHILVVDGMVVGGWRRTFSKGEVVVDVNSQIPLHGPLMEALATARVEGRAACTLGIFLSGGDASIAT
jgi:hypothetical protein